jgi:hypothetical protein
MVSRLNADNECDSVTVFDPDGKVVKEMKNESK